MMPHVNTAAVDILIAEDSHTQAERLQYILEQQGYRSRAVRNGVEALDAVTQRVPTLVISDIIMPQIDGYELCRRMKQEESLRNIPVMLLTSLSDPADVVKGLEAGADSFIFKPYEDDYLLARVAYILANRHLRASEGTRMGIEIFFAGRKFFITSDRLQILNLLLSTYEAAVRKNEQLRAAQEELRNFTEYLELKVKERTAALEQTQRAVMQQERLRALAQMAGGIAHDINNAISPVALYVEMLLEREKGLSPQSRTYLEVVQRAIEDVGQTVGRMREFYRHREPEVSLAPIDLNRVMEQVVDLTRARWSDIPQQQGIVIELQRDLALDPPTVMGVESEIRDALTNLVFNAVDAMPQGGTLTVRTRVAYGSAAQVGEQAAVFVEAEVVDTGIGMDEQTRRHCMEPFFTTKGDRGTGLGLAMVYGMVQRHGAQMAVESVPGQGTTVRLAFATGVAATAAAAAPAYDINNLTPLRILIVDDDPVLLQSLRDTLQLDGHTVIGAGGGQAGIDAFTAAQARGECISAVITDLGMPYVDGASVAKAVKAASPLTPVILLTGWGQRLVLEREVPAHVDQVLSKPPKLRELREALAHIGDRRVAPAQ